MSIIRCLVSVVLILSLLGLASMCGLGLLRLCGLHHFRRRILLAPALALSLSGILVAVVVLLGIPVNKASPPIWLLWIFLTAVGASCVRSAWTDLHDSFILIVCLLATLVISGEWVRYGLFDYLGSPALDGWSYVSFGEYLYRYARGIEGGLAPVYQYASHLSATRYVASALLALLIPPWVSGFDTQMMVGPLLILSIFSYAVSVAYAAKVLSETGLSVPAWLTVFLGVVGGWVPVALNANNYDNMLALPFAPILFAIALDRSLNRVGHVILPAIFIAASFYIYPELSPLVVLAYVVVAIQGLLYVKPGHSWWMDIRPLVGRYSVMAVVTFLIISPYLSDAIVFFGQQLSLATQVSGRPGEGFMPYLLDKTRVWGVMWGLGDSDEAVVLGVLLGLIALLGIIRAYVKKHFALIIYFSIVVILFIKMSLFDHYDYGAYKILLLGWWVVAIVLASGVGYIWEVVPSPSLPRRWFTRATISSVLVVSAVTWINQPDKWKYTYSLKTSIALREARDAVVASNRVVQVSVKDTMLNSWLVYQLRNVTAFFTEYHGYMDQVHVRPIMARSMVPDSGEVTLILAETSSFTTGDVVWRNKLFKLVQGTPAEQPPDFGIDAPNGRESLGGMPFFWIGLEPASIVFTATKQQLISFEFESIVGPSVGADPKDNPVIFFERPGTKMIKFDKPLPSTQTVKLTLLPGVNTFVFRPTYNGVTVPNVNGDPRILLVGIKVNGLKVDD